MAFHRFLEKEEWSLSLVFMQNSIWWWTVTEQSAEQLVRAVFCFYLKGFCASWVWTQLFALVKLVNERTWVTQSLVWSRTHYLSADKCHNSSCWGGGGGSLLSCGWVRGADRSEGAAEGTWCWGWGVLAVEQLAVLNKTRMFPLLSHVSAPEPPPVVSSARFDHLPTLPPREHRRSRQRPVAQT